VCEAVISSQILKSRPPTRVGASTAVLDVSVDRVETEELIGKCRRRDDNGDKEEPHSDSRFQAQQFRVIQIVD